VQALLKSVETAVSDLNIDANIVRVDDTTEIMDRGVMLRRLSWMENSKSPGASLTLKSSKSSFKGEKRQIAYDKDEALVIRQMLEEAI
jgi:hypothetical protein